ncbi:hypothetical protein HMI54_007313 [Coelomomyces lativittatus]|nr:hypothetical protein HMI54_007313 [Coelomomyces lativittatus]KAJ1507829.1 hypothetical protein HMI56_007595 [Coelomomyces lativittatus]
MDREEGPCTSSVHVHSDIKLAGSTNTVTRISSMNSGNTSSTNSSPTNNSMTNRKRQRIYDLQSPWSTPNSFSCVHLGSSNLSSSSSSSGLPSNLDEDHGLHDNVDANDKHLQPINSLHPTNASLSISGLSTTEHHRSTSIPNFLTSSSSSSSSSNSSSSSSASSLLSASSSFSGHNLSLCDVTSNSLMQSRPPGATKGRRKIDITYIKEKNRRHITFSKRKAGIVKKVILIFNFFFFFRNVTVSHFSK